MFVDVDMELCESHGECVYAAPEVFELDQSDTLHWNAEPEDRLRAAVEEAVRGCPVQAIRVEAGMPKGTHA